MKRKLTGIGITPSFTTILLLWATAALGSSETNTVCDSWLTQIRSSQY